MDEENATTPALISSESPAHSPRNEENSQQKLDDSSAGAVSVVRTVPVRLSYLSRIKGPTQADENTRMNSGNRVRKDFTSRTSGGARSRTRPNRSNGAGYSRSAGRPPLRNTAVDRMQQPLSMWSKPVVLSDDRNVPPSVRISAEEFQKLASDGEKGIISEGIARSISESRQRLQQPWRGAGTPGKPTARRFSPNGAEGETLPRTVVEVNIDGKGFHHKQYAARGTAAEKRKAAMAYLLQRLKELEERKKQRIEVPIVPEDKRNILVKQWLATNEDAEGSATSSAVAMSEDDAMVIIKTPSLASLDGTTAYCDRSEAAVQTIPLATLDEGVQITPRGHHQDSSPLNTTTTTTTTHMQARSPGMNSISTGNSPKNKNDRSQQNTNVQPSKNFVSSYTSPIQSLKQKDVSSMATSPLNSNSNSLSNSFKQSPNAKDLISHFEHTERATPPSLSLAESPLKKGYVSAVVERVEHSSAPSSPRAHHNDNNSNSNHLSSTVRSRLSDLSRNANASMKSNSSSVAEDRSMVLSAPSSPRATTLSRSTSLTSSPNKKTSPPAAHSSPALNKTTAAPTPSPKALSLKGNSSPHVSSPLKAFQGREESGDNNRPAPPSSDSDPPMKSIFSSPGRDITTTTTTTMLSSSPSSHPSSSSTHHHSSINSTSRQPTSPHLSNNPSPKPSPVTSPSHTSLVKPPKAPPVTWSKPPPPPVQQEEEERSNKNEAAAVANGGKKVVGVFPWLKQGNAPQTSDATPPWVKQRTSPEDSLEASDTTTSASTSSAIEKRTVINDSSTTSSVKHWSRSASPTTDPTSSTLPSEIHRTSSRGSTPPAESSSRSITPVSATQVDSRQVISRKVTPPTSLGRIVVPQPKPQVMSLPQSAQPKSLAASASIAARAEFLVAKVKGVAVSHNIEATLIQSAWQRRAARLVLRKLKRDADEEARAEAELAELREVMALYIQMAWRERIAARRSRDEAVATLIQLKETRRRDLLKLESRVVESVPPTTTSATPSKAPPLMSSPPPPPPPDSSPSLKSFPSTITVAPKQLHIIPETPLTRPSIAPPLSLLSTEPLSASAVPPSPAPLSLAASSSVKGSNSLILSAQPDTPPSLPSYDTIDSGYKQRLKVLESGQVLVKYAFHKKKKQFKHVSLSQDCTFLKVQDDGSKSKFDKIAISDVTELTHGVKTANLIKLKKGMKGFHTDEWLLFSLSTTDRSYDFAAGTADVLVDWFMGVQGLLYSTGKCKSVITEAELRDKRSKMS